jgi:hypothetical protein
MASWFATEWWLHPPAWHSLPASNSDMVNSSAIPPLPGPLERCFSDASRLQQEGLWPPSKDLSLVSGHVFRSRSVLAETPTGSEGAAEGIPQPPRKRAFSLLPAKSKQRLSDPPRNEKWGHFHFPEPGFWHQSFWGGAGLHPCEQRPLEVSYLGQRGKPMNGGPEWGR